MFLQQVHHPTINFWTTVASLAQIKNELVSVENKVYLYGGLFFRFLSTAPYGKPLT